MCEKKQPVLTEVVKCQAKRHPCPTCGKNGTRVRKLFRKVRSIAYKQVAWLHVHYAEYTASCSCCKSFRSCPDSVLPKAAYSTSVRQAVLDRILDDGLNVERTRSAMLRDFLLELSSGFIYDCLDWALTQLDLPEHRYFSVQSFSGILCVDELHLGNKTLLLATDPISDLIIAFAVVSANDQDHMRRFLNNLKSWGFLPRQVITDGSNLYPKVLAEIWPQATHQLCIFHILQDLNKQILDAVRRLRMTMSRRGNAGRKRKRGRPKKSQKQREKPLSNKEKAAFVFKWRYLIVKRQECLTQEEREALEKSFEYIPELKTLWKFSQELYRLWQNEQSRKVARWRWTRMKNKEEYKEVEELAKVQEWMSEEKFEKTQEFLKEPEETRQKTNNHVERMNRKMRFAEKSRYKWRRTKSIVRFILLQLGRQLDRAKAKAATACEQAPPVPPLA